MKSTYMIVFLLIAGVIGYMIGSSMTRNKPKDVQVPMHDYQIELYKDSIFVYDRNRLVGWYVTNHRGQMDSILVNDKE